MKKLFVLSALLAAIVLASMPASASTFCLKDSYGEYYIMKGGKPDVRSYAVKVDVPGLCVVGGHAEITIDGTGKYILAITTSHDSAGNCIPVRWIATGDQYLNSTGSYDQHGDGTVDGAVTFTAVSCSSLPSYGPDQMLSTMPNPDNPFLKK